MKDEELLELKDKNLYKVTVEFDVYVVSDSVNIVNEIIDDYWYDIKSNVYPDDVSINIRQINSKQMVGIDWLTSLPYSDLNFGITCEEFLNIKEEMNKPTDKNQLNLDI